MKNARGYTFSRSFMGERVPQHIQNLVIRDYCSRNNLHYLLSGTEYAMPNCHLIFEQLLDDIGEISGLVLYSLFQLPESAIARKKVYKKIEARNKTLHFAVENMCASNIKQFDRIETLWRIRITLPESYLAV